MEAIAESNELTIFETQAIIDLIDFKWDMFGYSAQTWGTFTNVIYTCAVTYYVIVTFIPR
jgi:hypothetical protein